MAPVETYTPPVDRSRRRYRDIRLLCWTFRNEGEQSDSTMPSPRSSGTR